MTSEHGHASRSTTSVLLAGAVHGEGFAEDASGGGGKVEALEFVFAGEGHIGDVAAGTGFTGDAFAEVIDDDVVEARAAGRIANIVTFLLIDAVENFDEVEDTDFKAGFLEQFAGNTFL